MTADLRTTSTDVLGVPDDIAEAAVRAGLQSVTGTIAFAGQNTSGTYSVQFNAQNGSGYSSSWPQWAAFALAKDAYSATRERGSDPTAIRSAQTSYSC
jgi:hypothetical protein